MTRAWLPLIAALAGCGGAAVCTPPPAGIELDGAIDRMPRLSDWCFLRTQKGALVSDPRLLPYDLTTPLFSDYALKLRSIWLPQGTQVTYDASGPFAFPVGAVITKTFQYPADLRQPEVGVRRVETRLLVRNPAGWLALPYVWNAAQDEATLEIAGRQVDVDFLDDTGAGKTAHYLVPTATQCMQCHEAGMQTEPIGPKARLWNRDHPYAGGSENQLAHWSRLGLLAGAPAPADAPRLTAFADATAPVADRARAWLEVNCGHCHSDTGLARTTGLSLLASETDLRRLGQCKGPVAAGPGSGGRPYDIVPGKPDQSILVYRIESTTPGMMMPEIGRSMVHAEGVALVRQWIAELPGACN